MKNENNSSPEQATRVIEKACESTQVDFIRYDPDKRLLQIEYKKDKKYFYMDVAPEVWAEMIQAKSVGQFINQNIRGKYEYLQTDSKLI